MKRITKPDTKNEDPQYWEEVLESHGLGIRHLQLEEVVIDEYELTPEELEHKLSEEDDDE